MTTTQGLSARQCLFGLEVDALTLAEVVQICEAAVAHRRYLRVGDLNAATISAVRRDPVLRRSVQECDLLLADGQSVVWASRFLGRRLPARIAGVDLFQALLGLADRRGLSVYFLGSTAENLERLTSVVSERWPGLRLAGSHDGYFTETELPAVLDDIRHSGADLLFLGMPSPKKELFATQHGARLGVPVVQGVGGSFDVVSGALRRAPALWQAAGMEWAYRLVQEPRRLWRRYLTTNSAFVALTLRERVRPTPSFGRRRATP